VGVLFEVGSDAVMKLLVLGSTGMLGSAMLQVFSEQNGWDVYGSIRSGALRKLFPDEFRQSLVTVGDLSQLNELEAVFDKVEPQVVVNCVAPREIARQNPLDLFSMLSLLPHRLAYLCQKVNARLIHISSDGVFSGKLGGYTEDHMPDATDIYGISKLLGEVKGPKAVTIRTSIIGHELSGRTGLLEWFLRQKGECRCFTRAIFSGLPTVVLATVIRDLVIPMPELHGIYHVSSDPISKFDLLTIIAKEYGKTINIVADDTVVMDRSLISDRFREITEYEPPSWPELVRIMHTHTDMIL